MFSKKHYINWLSSLFIIAATIILSSNFKLIEIAAYIPKNYLFNSILLIIIFYVTYKYLNPDKIDLYIVLFALILSFISYSSLFPLCFYLVFLLFFFRNNLKILFSYLCILLLFSFIIHFYLTGKFGGVFFYWNIPWGWIAVLYLITLYTGWMVSDIQEVYFSTGIIIFLWSLIFWLSNDKSYLDSLTMSSFFISIPFFALAIKKYKVDKFLGKVYNDL